MEDPQEFIITDFSSKGDGVALHPKGFKVEIPHTMPQDKVLASFGKKRKNVSKGRLVELLTPSPHRVPPRCEHTRICGGCTCQELSYAQQLLYKEEKIKRSFGDLLTIPMETILPSDPFFEYRNKMEFSFSENRAKTRFLGLMIARAQNFVFNVNRCHLASPWVSQVLNAVRSWWEEENISAYQVFSNQGVLRTLTCREGKATLEKMVILLISADEVLLESQEKSFVQKILSVVPDANILLRFQKIEKKKPTEFFEKVLFGKPFIEEHLSVAGKIFRFQIGSTSFFQPNTFQAEKIYQKALEMVLPKKFSVIYDLYCGTGTIGMIFSPFAEKVIGVEINKEAVENGKTNLSLNKIQNFSFFEGDVEKILEKDLLPPELIIVDPPRAGLSEKVQAQINRLNAPYLLYISCNPSSQARDIRSLAYTIKKIQPVDQFPHTAHVENIVLLEKKA